MGEVGVHFSKRPVAWATCLAVAVLAWFLPLPASGHDGHGSVPVVTDATAGPFVVSAWMIEHSTTGTMGFYVVARGDAEPETIEVIRADGRVVELSPTDEDRTWSGILTADEELGSVEIRLTDHFGNTGTVSVSLAPPVVPGMSLIVLILLAQALVTFAWLMLRWRRVWGRNVQANGSQPAEART